ncbi:MAG: hypothetical protein WBD40_06515 [Tepidisphaeraceae bacterium]
MEWKEVTEALGECERKLRRLVAEAVNAGDYAAVLRITDLAKAVAGLAEDGRSGDPALPGRSGDPALPPATAMAAVGGAANRVIAATAPAPILRRSRAEDYPKFFRRGDELVKVGWSKKERKEYNHRAPRRAVDAVAVAVRQIGAKGKLFLGDALLPLKDPADGRALPDYQAYVALAWLKELSLVEQHGRRAGYSLVPGKQIDSAVTSAWSKLVEWRG